MSNPSTERDERVRRAPERVWLHAMLDVATNPCGCDKDVEYLRADIASDTATRMRDRCVQKVKSLQDEWNNADSNEIGEEYAGAMVDACNEIITALQSLTLEQGEQEK